MTTITTTTTVDSQIRTSRLTDEMLARFAERAPTYDRENRFFAEDFEDLRAGYLKIAVPRDLGGDGLTLEIATEQGRLAYRARTALAVNMHLYWLGVAGTSRHLGDNWLRLAPARGGGGRGVRERAMVKAGNDCPSTAKAERVDGGYKFYGREQFGSLTPVWTRLGIHAMDTSDPSTPDSVHAFMPRDTPGYGILDTWDTLGMRATRSDDTVLEGAFVPDECIGHVRARGALDPFIGAIFANALLNFGAIYYAVAERAADLAIASARKRASLAVSRSMAARPGGPASFLGDDSGAGGDEAAPREDAGRWSRTASTTVRPGR